MILTFEKNKILEIVAAVEAGTGHLVPYTGEGWSCPLETTPGLLLVGDEGVYLIGNEKTERDKPNLVAYANESNPRRMDFYQCRRAKEASFGSNDGIIFFDLKTVKSSLLANSFPYILFTSDKICLGSVDNLEEIIDPPTEESKTVVEIIYLDDLIEAELEDVEEANSRVSYRYYTGAAQVPFRFAVEEMDIDPDDYDYSKYFLSIDFYMNPVNLWARCDLDNYGILYTDQLDLYRATYQGISLAELAVSEMYEWYESVEEQLLSAKCSITCNFNPDQLPRTIKWEAFHEVVSAAFKDISPNSKLSINISDHYAITVQGFSAHRLVIEYFLQFLVYKWIMENRPELLPHRWLPIRSSGPENCFPCLIAQYYRWPLCEVQ